MKTPRRGMIIAPFLLHHLFQQLQAALAEVVTKREIDFRRLFYNALLVRKTIKTEFAVIASDSARAHATKRQVRRCQMNQCIVNRPSAERNGFDHFFPGFPVFRKEI